MAAGFRIAGWVVGIPALLASICLGVGAILLAAGPAKTPYLNDSKYGVLGVLINGVHAVTDAITFVGAMAGLVLAILAGVGLAIALFALLLYLIGRGLKVAATWARIVGGLIAAVFSVYAALALSVLDHAGEVVDGLVVAAWLYVLWTLIWRFADPAPRPPTSASV